MMNLLRMTFITREKLSDLSYEKAPEIASDKGRIFESADIETSMKRNIPTFLRKGPFLLEHPTLVSGEGEEALVKVLRRNLCLYRFG